MLGTLQNNGLIYNTSYEGPYIHNANPKGL